MKTEHSLDVEGIKDRLVSRRAGRCLGQNLVYLPATESTNDVAKALGRKGAPEGTLVVADEQTAGRGRRGRLWQASAGECLLMSLLLRPRIPASDAFTLTMLAGTSILAAIERLTGLSCGLKWPNDVLIGGLKTAGILTELVITKRLVDSAVVGIGLNVNADMSAFPEIATTATSLATELGRPVDRADLLLSVLKEFEDRYLPADYAQRTVSAASESPQYAQWQSDVFLEWKSRLVTLGQWVTVSDGYAISEGLAEDVQADGTLVVRQQDGTTITVATGDVSLRPKLS